LRDRAAISEDGHSPHRVVSADSPSELEVRAALEKLLASSGFRNSERMRRFLRVTVERTLDGATDQLKEFSLGHDVFDRGADYDPRTDSIVRVEARRLRKKLLVYYAGEGLMPLAKRAAEVAIRLDPGFAHAYTSLAWVTFCYEWSWEEGMAVAQKALVLEPNYAYGHMALGAFYMVLGRIPEGRERLEYSLRLDPLSIRAHRLRGLALTMEGKFEEADQRMRAARALMPASHELAWMMAAVYLAHGRKEEGLRYARECQTEPAVPRMLAMLREALACAGQEEAAREILRRVEELSAREYVDPWLFCRQHMALGDVEKALHFLGRSFEERSTLALFAPIDPLLKPLRTDPRFREIIARLHLPAHPQSLVAKT
jgi:tetratricopeptide (TPR) repeat protein